MRFPCIRFAETHQTRVRTKTRWWHPKFLGIGRAARTNKTTTFHSDDDDDNDDGDDGDDVWLVIPKQHRGRWHGTLALEWQQQQHQRSLLWLLFALTWLLKLVFHQRKQTNKLGVDTNFLDFDSLPGSGKSLRKLLRQTVCEFPQTSLWQTNCLRKLLHCKISNRSFNKWWILLLINTFIYLKHFWLRDRVAGTCF